MATTILPRLGAPDPEISIAEALNHVRELHIRAQGDLDKTDSMDEGHYYAGMVDACTELESILTVSDEVEKLVTKLGSEVEQTGLLDVGKGADKVLGVSQMKLRAALQILEDEGYLIMAVKVKQQGYIKGTPVERVVKVLATPGTTYKYVYDNADKIKSVEGPI